MLTTAMLLLRSSLFLSLHLAGNTGSFPKPLSAEEEQAYLARCAGGDLEARNVLVERNMRLVAHIIKKYYTQTVDQDDLISIGTIGLIKGISSYKPEKNVRLATYAARCIENEILMFFRSQKSCKERSPSPRHWKPTKTATISSSWTSSAWRTPCWTTLIPGRAISVSVSW